MDDTFEPENHKYPASLFFEDLRVGETYYIPSRTLSDANFAKFASDRVLAVSYTHLTLPTICSV